MGCMDATSIGQVSYHVQMVSPAKALKYVRDPRAEATSRAIKNCRGMVWAILMVSPPYLDDQKQSS